MENPKKEIPENIKNMLESLSYDVSFLHGKWDFYLGLFADIKNLNLFSKVAPWSFLFIEDSLQKDLTMAIARLCDKPISYNEKNLSLATLVIKCPNIPGVNSKYKEFKDACKTVINARNKKLSHNDLETALNPKENPLLQISKTQVKQILKLANDILNMVSYYHKLGSYDSHLIGVQDAEFLISVLKAGIEKLS